LSQAGQEKERRKSPGDLNMKNVFRKCFVAIVAMMMFAGSASASVFPLNTINPDIFGTGSLTHNGTNFSFVGESKTITTDDFGTENLIQRSLNIAASFTGQALDLGGTLIVNGDATGPNGGPVAAGDPLLTGNLLAYSNGPDPGPAVLGVLQFSFEVTGGTLSALYGGVGAKGGIKVGIGFNTFDPQQSLSISNNTAKVDIFPINTIPEPATATLMI
jgi:hypothetical protein